VPEFGSLTQLAVAIIAVIVAGDKYGNNNSTKGILQSEWPR